MVRPGPNRPGILRRVTTDSHIPSFIGAPVQRREDPALITGTARYVEDITPAGTLHLAFVRSPFAHAEIAGIEAVPKIIDGNLSVHGCSPNTAMQHFARIE